VITSILDVIITVGEAEMEKKTFTFKLADKAANGASKWRTRDGVALAGCSDVTGDGDLRYNRLRLGDSGEYC
jgi:hypothetical protein